MKLKYIFTQLLLLYGFSMFGQHGGALSMEQMVLQDQLFQIQWLDELTDTDKELIKDGLTSDKIDLQVEALKAVSVHTYEEFEVEFPQLRQQPAMLSPEINSIISDAFRQGKNNFFPYLKNKVNISDLIFSEERHNHEEVSASKILVSILTTNMCKSLRQNKEPNYELPIDWLSHTQQQLVEYSQLKNEIAVNTILSKLSSSELLQNEGHDLLQILNSYGALAVKQSMDRITSNKKLKQISTYGRIMLLRNLKQSLRWLSAADKIKIREVLQSKKSKSNYFEQSLSLKGMVILLEGHLESTINYTAIQSKLEALGDPQKKEEMIQALTEKIRAERAAKIESQAQEVPRAPKKPSFQRPEDRGEDFSTKTIAELIALFKVSELNAAYTSLPYHKSEKAIALRKAANVLGERQAQGQLQLSREQQYALKQATEFYLDLAKRGTPQAFEEGNLQIQRLAQLAAPALLENLDSPNPKRKQAASQFIMDIRDEAITRKIVEKAKAAEEERNIKWYRSMLQIMQQPPRPIIKHRSAMKKAASDSLYRQLIQPSLRTLEEKLK